MKTRNVISNLPIKLPWMSTVVYSFMLHYFNANGVIIGVFATIYAIYWIIAIIAKWNEKSVDIFEQFEQKKQDSKEKISPFQQKLRDLKNKQ